ncbi:unnamed protein product [Vitrella brassicaformis CCMP3155]|uniref:Dynein light chain n=1 Tax=Vitrella brassicaformis (strain CCMP3155) TaxID=1169540 RepID=A0A0G4GKL5_VITBC|nr:unnamed protein product [Vitrella brassicaformis CCMP3155]|mmetsp:Transcript_26157/g.65008  ORF Transcript_26157/g.65008 Transcript_26157/m.65008 type:complete len:94 (-) Transcript_26157:122-403(-)|eukprot:CEM30538.1 unnamed protein product [Vitrella brassicaformis CCMP3155]
MSTDNKYSKVIIRNQEMPEHMRKDAEEQAVKAFELYRTESEISDHIKKFFDSTHTPTWNCITGKNFGAFVTHETKRYLYFGIGHLNILLWKCG